MEDLKKSACGLENMISLFCYLPFRTARIRKCWLVICQKFLMQYTRILLGLKAYSIPHVCINTTMNISKTKKTCNN
jgi:hypothetical protein